LPTLTVAVAANSHKAKNFKEGADQGSKVGKAVVELQVRS